MDKKRSWSELPSRIFLPEPAGKDVEARLVREFLHIIGIVDYTLEATERPDFFIRFVQDGQPVVCGCELTRFHSDVSKEKGGGSPEQRFFNQWKRFAYRLRADLLKASDRFGPVYGAVFFKEPRLDIFDGCDEAALRGEIVELLRSWAGEATLREFDPRRFPLLARLVDHIYIEETAIDDGPLWWCAHLQSGTVDDPSSVLADIVTRKIEAARGYSWGTATLKWLVVCARSQGLADAGLVTKASSIDRDVTSVPYTEIFYWERFSGSIKELYPVFRDRSKLPGVPPT